MWSPLVIVYDTPYDVCIPDFQTHARKNVTRKRKNTNLKKSIITCILIYIKYTQPKILLHNIILVYSNIKITLFKFIN